MTSFPWWTEEHKKLAADVEGCAAEIMQMSEIDLWNRKVAFDAFKIIGERGFFGASVSKEYGGMGLGTTGACIVCDVLNTVPGIFFMFVSAMIGGTHQVEEFGTEEQKREYLPRIAKGELGCVLITEPVAGTDAAAIEVMARKEGDKYILNGKKRFNTGIGTAGHYFLYARTSDDPEKIARYQHLTAFMIDGGLPGFSVEKINELLAMENSTNGHVDFDNVVVSEKHRVGKEGEGWKIMMSGLTFERTIIGASNVGALKVALTYTSNYARRRIQFNKPTTDLVNNQFKIADLMTAYKTIQLAVYYAAYLSDTGADSSVYASIGKLLSSDMSMDVLTDAVQVVGGDAVTRFYPLERLFREAKLCQIAGGTSEAIKLVIYRMGLKALEAELVWPYRTMHPEHNIPVTATPVKQHVDEDGLLRVLAEDFRINPGLHMTMDDLKRVCDIDDKTLDELLLALEAKKLAHLVKKRGRIDLAKATYDGLKKAYPPEYYRWIPEWAKDYAS